MSITLVCVECGAEDSIVGDDKILVYANIGGWDMLPDGTLEPEWLDATVHWDTQQPRSAKAPYCCRECMHQYSGADLIALIKKEE